MSVRKFMLSRMYSMVVNYDIAAVAFALQCLKRVWESG